MNYEALESRYPLNPEAYRPHLNASVTPPLDLYQLDSRLLHGSARSSIKTPVNGNLSIVLYYKEKESLVASFETSATDDLRLLQLQGANSSKSYRVATGLRGQNFMAQEALALALHPESGIHRLVVPNLTHIEGIDSVQSELALMRYKGFAVYALLRWSQEEDAYVRDVR
jgi:hypothetical protein